MLRKQISITYSHGLIQYFFVISHKWDYLEIIKPAEIRIYEIEGLNKKQQKKYSEELAALKEELKEFSFRWCTEKSPIYKSVETQILSLLPQQGGDIKVTSKFI